MKTKNTVQTTLPFDLKSKTSNEVNDYVKQHWNVTFARQGQISVCAKRIMATVLTQVKNDSAFRPYYQIHISKVIPSGTDILNGYREVKKAFVDLQKIVWTFEDLKTRRFTPRQLLDTTKNLEKDGFECGYHQGMITIVINPNLEPYFLNLSKNYTTHDLKWFMTLTSWYSMRMYEILSSFKDTGWWRPTIEEFRELMDCKKKYPKINDLIKNTLKEPLKELEETPFAFTYQPIFGEKLGPGRPSISGLEFKLKTVKPKNPLFFAQRSDKHRRAVERLKEFKVTESNIIQYIEDIGLEQTWELLNDWMKKGNEIQDRKKYCNAVWIRIGKKKQSPEPSATI